MEKREASGRLVAVKSVETDNQEDLNGNPRKSLRTTNGQRFSARIQEKQNRLGSTAQKVEDVQAGNLNSGSDFAVSPKGLELSQECVDEKQDLNQTLELEEKKDKQKTRNWELWSEFNKQLFFEALNEHGKDFDAIQNYLAGKTKKKSGPGFVSKNKNQIRHFYYRTWNKISKDLQFPEEMKKSSQELYGLVNYGELRKKLQVFGAKAAGKLSELVKSGITLVKVQGKTFRVKTPVCKALKQLNHSENVEESRLPSKISLELLPKNIKAWATVQNVSHNPRVKVNVPLQRTLASVITYLEDKWKNKFEKLKQTISSTFGGKTVPGLRIFFLDENSFHRSTFKPNETTRSSSLGSNTEKGMGKEISKETQLSIEPSNSGKLNSDALKKLNNEKQSESKCLESVHKDSPNELIIGGDYLTNKKLLQSTDLFGSSEDVNDHVKNFEHGWTAVEAGATTIGEIYLMVGKNEKLHFEYCWDESEDYSPTNRILDKLTSIATALKKKKAKSLGGFQCANTEINLVPNSTFQNFKIPPVATSIKSFVNIAELASSESYFLRPNSCTTAIPESSVCNLMWANSAPVSGEKISQPKVGTTKIVSRNVIEVTPPLSGKFVLLNDSINPKKTPPTIFKDLPKGNRRIGRRPNFKKTGQFPQRNLLPKPSIMNTSSDNLNNSTWPKDYSAGISTPISNNQLIIAPAVNVISPLPADRPYASKDMFLHVPKRITPTTIRQNCKTDENSQNFLANLTSSNNTNKLGENLDEKSIPDRVALEETFSNSSWSALMDISLPEFFKEGVNDFVSCLDLDDSLNSNFSLSDIQIEEVEDKSTKVQDFRSQNDNGRKIIVSSSIQTPQKSFSPLNNFGSQSPTFSGHVQSFLVNTTSQPGDDLSLSNILGDM